MKDLAELIKAFASLAWPLVVLFGLCFFKRELGSLFGRLKRGKIFGQELELDSVLDKLERSVPAAAKEVENLAQQDARPSFSAEPEAADATIKSILQQAATAPKIALISLGGELERRAKEALAKRGLLAGRPTVSVGQALSELQQYGFPPNLTGSMKLFADVRNKIVHGSNSTDDDALRAIDSGLTILKAIDALPAETNVVHHPGVELFSDAECTCPIVDAKGVISETTSPGGVIKTFRIFPTTRKHFQKGKQVAWEWNMGRVWSAAWYRDPQSGEAKPAWHSSAEFIGRHVDDL